MARDRRSSTTSPGPSPGGSSGPARQGGGELLAAYVDGVSELTAEERRALEERLASDGALRAEADETRALLDRLRELPRAPAGEPDWAALERSILRTLDAVGPEVPRPWWRRLGLRWAMPAAALAVGAAILALVVRPPARELAPAIGVVAPERGGAEAAPPTPPTPPTPGDTMALWLDGEDVEIDLAADPLELDLPEVPWESDHHLEDLLPPSDLAWVDELVGEELDRAEALLEEPAPEPPVRRKRS